MKLFLVEIRSGCTDDGEAMIFDSIWSTQENAEEYCQKFKHSGYLRQEWDHSITPVTLDEGN